MNRKEKHPISYGAGYLLGLGVMGIVGIVAVGFTVRFMVEAFVWGWGLFDTIRGWLS